MLTRRSGARRARTRRAPVDQPAATITEARGFAHRNTVAAKSSVLGSRLAAAALFFAALGCFIFAVGDVHASPVRAAIAVVAGAALWITGEAVSR